MAKPFVFALVCQALGPEEARDWLGAIATASLAPGASQGERWEFLRDGLWETRHGYVGLP